MVYFERFVFMALLLIPAFFHTGARSAAVCVFSVLCCMLADFICCRVRKIPYDVKDSSVLFWGLAAAMLMPVSMPYLLAALSAVICVVVGKHMFGGGENVVFSPAAISAAFLIICYPSDMLYCPRVGEIMPVFGEYSGTLIRSVEYGIKLGNVPAVSQIDLLLGSAPGSIGAVNILVVLVCGVCMVIRRSTSMGAVVSCAATVSLLAFAFPRIPVSPAESVFYELSCGYLLFGIVFLSAEPYLIPKRRAARVIYGIVLGYTVMMFRYFGQAEGCFVFALLITNALSNCFDTIVENVIYWKTTYISSFESSKEEALKGGIKLTDTQEIVIPEKYKYNTPPIDGEVKRHRRSRKKEKDKEDSGDE